MFLGTLEFCLTVSLLFHRPKKEAEGAIVSPASLAANFGAVRIFLQFHLARCGKKRGNTRACYGHKKPFKCGKKHGKKNPSNKVIVSHSWKTFRFVDFSHCLFRVHILVL